MAGLAAIFADRSGQFRADRTDDLCKLREAAAKAIQLDPMLAESHDALGRAFAQDAKWEQSETSFRRSIELDPSNSISYSFVPPDTMRPSPIARSCCQTPRSK